MEEIKDCKKATVENFLKELDSLGDEELIDIDPKPQFIKLQVDPFDNEYPSVINQTLSPELQSDSTFINFGHWHSHQRGITVSELRKLLAPIVSARPDLIVCVDERIKNSPVKRVPIRIDQNTSVSCKEFQLQVQSVENLSFLQSLNKITDPSTICKIVKDKFPSLVEWELLIVGDQIFTYSMFYKRYPAFSKGVYKDFINLFEEKKYGLASIFVCLIPLSVMDARFTSNKTECERLVEEYKKLFV